ncbi:hypothetical protein [Methylocystis bryophila]|uniref:Uncharacterized protein n=1 Tax=Methylocystis bryophila TaxID=655015 RepID=A0A1W6MYA5_9HYPH|nr:hypothetical protein B1812_17450 [Methylocystis bryophila]
MWRDPTGGASGQQPSVGVNRQTATQEVMASVMAAEAAKIARMAVGAFIDVSRIVQGPALTLTDQGAAARRGNSRTFSRRGA